MGALFVLLNAIVEAGGPEVRLNDHGAVLGRNATQGRLPFLDVTTLSQLRRNGFLDVRREGSEYVIGLGERTRQIAARYGIKVEVG